MATPDSLLNFWFREVRPQQHWQKDAAFDQLLHQRFGALHASACRCELAAWRGSACGALAEIILLDQFSRNLYRDDPRAFAQDAQALSLAQWAIVQGYDQSLDSLEKSFLYMPFMHSESILIHQQALHLFSAPGLENNLQYARRHFEIIERFGRYPHRNSILGRTSTVEEEAFLQQPGSSF